jgi:hypothetical protein
MGGIDIANDGMPAEVGSTGFGGCGGLQTGGVCN